MRKQFAFLIASFAFFFIQCSHHDELNEGDANFYYTDEDSTLHKAADTIIHGVWQPFIADTGWQILRNEFTKNYFAPSYADSSTFINIDTNYRVFEFPEGGPGDTIIGVIPDTIILKPTIKKLILPEPKAIDPMRPVNNASDDILYLNAEQGLPSNSVGSIKADAFGRIWMSTANGVVCYDGNYMITLGKKNGLVSDKMSDLFFDSHGYLWCGSAEGFSVTNGIVVYNFSNKIFDQIPSVTYFFEDSKSRIWLAINGLGAGYFDGKNLILYGANQGLETINSTTVVEDRYGRFWIGAYDKEPSIISGDTIFNTTYWGPLWTYIEFESLQDVNGDLWYATYGSGACKIDFDDKFVYEFKTNGANSSCVVQAIEEDNENNMWFGLETKGIVCIPADGSPEFNISTANGLTDNTIQDIYCDPDGNLWVGTLAGGVCKVNHSIIKSHTKNQGISTHTVVSMFVDHNNTVYAGFWPGGFYRNNKDKWEQFHDGFGSHGSIVLDMKEDLNHDIWVSVHGFGMRRIIRDSIDDKSFILTENLYHKQGLSNVLTYNMIPGKDTSMYFFDSQEGLFVLKNDSVTLFSNEKSFANNSIYNGVFTKRNELIVGTYDHGLCIINNDSIKRITTREGLLSNKTRTLFVDNKNQIWISFNPYGLSKMSYENGKINFTHFTVEDGLSNAKVNAISQDSTDRIWVASSDGIFTFKPDENAPKKYQINQLTMTDGLKTMEFTTHSGVIDSTNTIWFGSRRGVTSIDLNRINFDYKQPNIVLQSLKINDNYFGFGASKNPHQNASGKFQYSHLAPFTNLPQDLKLDYFQNNLVFQFSSVQWQKKNDLTFSHRLVGLNNNWSAENKKQEINYSNLSPGVYTLEIKARIKNQEWSEPISYSFEIYPPWWQMWWFRILTLVILIVVIVQIFKWRTAQLVSRKNQLEQTVRERTTEIEEQKNIIEERQKETMDSIYYAKRIQYALLAHEDLMHQHLPNHFVYFMPKDVVSGDFYWATHKTKSTGNTSDLFYLAVCDSTGHGVPGAFMSLLNISFLNEAINEKNIFEPGKILDHTRKRLIENISKEGHQDGMDGILICIDKSLKKISYAAGNNSPVLINKNGLETLATDKMPIGKSDKSANFATYEIAFEDGDMLYLPTDGYSDQFGGGKIKPSGKKFKRNNLNLLFTQIHQQNLIQQKDDLHTTLVNWKGDFEQVDDITIVGIKLNDGLFKLGD